MVTSRATRITLVTRYLIGRLTCERHEREFCTRPFKITELEKGRWSWISNCSEAFHTDSWLAEANPGHSDRDAILQALLPGPRYGSTLGPGKARMMCMLPRAISTETEVRNYLIACLNYWADKRGVLRQVCPALDTPLCQIRYCHWTEEFLMLEPSANSFCQLTWSEYSPHVDKLQCQINYVRSTVQL